MLSKLSDKRYLKSRGTLGCCFDPWLSYLALICGARGIDSRREICRALKLLQFGWREEDGERAFVSHTFLVDRVKNRTKGQTPLKGYGDMSEDILL